MKYAEGDYIDGADFHTMRKCPECGSRNYRRETALALTTEVKNGVRMQGTQLIADMGHFECLDCGFSYGSSGVYWESGSK